MNDIDHHVIILKFWFYTFGWFTRLHNCLLQLQGACDPVTQGSLITIALE